MADDEVMRRLTKLIDDLGAPDDIGSTEGRSATSSGESVAQPPSASASSVLSKLPDLRRQLHELDTMHFALQTHLMDDTASEVHAARESTAARATPDESVYHTLKLLGTIRNPREGEFILDAPDFTEDSLNLIRTVLKGVYGVGSVLATPQEADAASSLYVYPGAMLNETELKQTLFKILHVDKELPTELVSTSLEAGALAVEEDQFEL